MQNVIRFLAATLLASLTLTANAQAASWSRIAGEGESFSFTGTRTVRYGAGSSWIQQTLTGGGQCTNAFFGADPINGTYKECDLLDVSAIGWTKVANENGSFTLSSTRRVRYGAGSSWVEQILSGPVSCNNATFGDPIGGVAKECDVLDQLATSVALSATPNPSTVGQAITMVARIAGSTPSGTVTFKDGASTLGNASLSGGTATFSAALSTAGSHSLSASYSGDEVNAPSVSTAVTQTVNASGTWTKIADENGSFNLASTRTVRYGANGIWIERSMSGPGTCSNAFFGSDPISGIRKECDVLDIAAAPSTIAVTASPRPAVVNQAVTLTATIGGTNPSGAVTFLDGSTTIASIPLITSATAGTATTTIPFASAGSHVITAAYAGDSQNGAVTSSPVTLQVNAAGPGPVSPGNMTWLYGYDPEGNRTQVTDPNGNFTGMSYDALQRMKTLVQPAPAPAQPTPTIRMAYDGQDHITSVTDPRSLTTTYGIDGLANTRAQTSPDTGTKTATYDAAGNLLTQTDARGKVTTYTYDAINRVKTIGYLSGVGSTFEYDGGSAPYPGSTAKLTKMTDESGVTTFTYDALGRLVTRAQLIGARTLATSYTWGTTGTATGKVTAMTYPSGAQVNYTYDSAGRPQALSVNPPNPNGIGTNTGGYFNLLGSITYNADSNITGWVWADGAPYRRTYDSFGRLASFPLGYPMGTGIAQGAIRSLSYDSAGRIIGYTHSNLSGPQAALDQGFGYDGLDRLTQQLTSTTTFGYSYDPTGNRLSRTVGGTTYSDTVSPTSNQLTQVQNQGNSGIQTNTQTYTPAGNLQNDGTITYAYSDRGRLASTVSAGQTTSYKYNALEQRTSKTGSLTPTGATYYAYDEQGKTIGEYDTSLTPIAETVYLGSTPVAALKQTGSASTSSIALNIGNIYADQIDTPRTITRNSDEAILWRWDQTEAFGNSTPQENPSALGTYSYNSRMPGQIYDSETQNFYNLNRDYQTSTGRYVQSDPIGLGGGINPYGYVGGAPLSGTDPSGLFVPPPVAVNPLGVAAFGGYVFGIGINIGWEAIAKKSVGNSFYDWFNADPFASDIRVLKIPKPSNDPTYKNVTPIWENCPPDDGCKREQDQLLRNRLLIEGMRQRGLLDMGEYRRLAEDFNKKVKGHNMRCPNHLVAPLQLGPA